MEILIKNSRQKLKTCCGRSNEVEQVEFESIMKAEDFKSLAQREFEYFREQDKNFSSKVHVRE